MKPWWPIPWTNPPAGSNSADITLANGRRFVIYDDEGRRKLDGVNMKWGRVKVSVGNPVQVIRYEAREVLPSGTHSKKYLRAETLMELLAILKEAEQTPRED